MKNKEVLEHGRQTVPAVRKTYKRPELKKHGKLKSTAAQQIVVYTTYYVF